jgi:molybdate transport system substrate-binding protein
MTLLQRYSVALIYAITALLLACFMLSSWVAKAEPVRVAVASNFQHAASLLMAEFEALTPHKAVLIFGSTGKQFAQISHGAPFDVFLAADSERPRLLEQQGLAVRGSRVTYAVGKLVLWSAQPNYAYNEGAALKGNEFKHLAIANPRHAPYGLAAKQFLQSQDLWQTLSSRLVRGENVNQTFQFVQSGNAVLGLVAKSQLACASCQGYTSYWEVPQRLYAPINQQAVLLRDYPAAKQFLLFLGSDAAQRIIQQNGYGLP